MRPSDDGTTGLEQEEIEQQDTLAGLLAQRRAANSQTIQRVAQERTKRFNVSREKSRRRIIPANDRLMRRFRKRVTGKPVALTEVRFVSIQARQGQNPPAESQQQEGK